MLLLTADHGPLFFLTEPEAIAEEERRQWQKAKGKGRIRRDAFLYRLAEH